MDLSDYFEPVDSEIIFEINPADKNLLGNCINIHTFENPPETLEKYHIAIVGIRETRGIIDDEYADGPDNIRIQLYKLFVNRKNVKIIDLGNLRCGKNLTDSYFALKDVLVELITNKVLPIILSGSSEFAYSNYQAFELLQKAVNITSVNSRLEIGSNPDDYTDQQYLARLILNKSNFLFNYTNLGYQTYLVNPDNLDLINKILFDAIRLGEVRSNIKEAEPYLRDSDILNFHLNAIRQPDAPGQKDCSPNGFSGEEACQLAKYAGMSDKITALGIYGYYPPTDNYMQTAGLVAQILWYFIDGFYQRKNDYPYSSLNQYKKFIVSLGENKEDIIFYKSHKSDRWWLEVSIKKDERKRNIIVACSYEDYHKACNKEIPDRWWKTYQKIC